MSEPASIIIARLGGEATVASVTGTAYTAPYRWQAVRAKGGTGGLIPQRHHRRLLDVRALKGHSTRAQRSSWPVDETRQSGGRARKCQ